MGGGAEAGGRAGAVDRRGCPHAKSVWFRLTTLPATIAINPIFQNLGGGEVNLELLSMMQILKLGHYYTGLEGKCKEKVSWIYWIAYEVLAVGPISGLL